MGFILAALFFNTLTAPVVKMTQNSEGATTTTSGALPSCSFTSPSTRLAPIMDGFFLDFESLGREDASSLVLH